MVNASFGTSPDTDLDELKAVLEPVGIDVAGHTAIVPTPGGSISVDLSRIDPDQAVRHIIRMVYLDGQKAAIRRQQRLTKLITLEESHHRKGRGAVTILQVPNVESAFHICDMLNRALTGKRKAANTLQISALTHVIELAGSEPAEHFVIIADLMQDDSTRKFDIRTMIDAWYPDTANLSDLDALKIIFPAGDPVRALINRWKVRRAITILLPYHLAAVFILAIFAYTHLT